MAPRAVRPILAAGCQDASGPVLDRARYWVLAQAIVADHRTSTVRGQLIRDPTCGGRLFVPMSTAELTSRFLLGL